MGIPRVVVIGAGIGGLTAAAALARSGFDVTVLEAHIYPGGCAGTFFHQGYCFDAGATLAGGFYPGGPMDKVAAAVGISRWPTQSTRRAMVVHLPDGQAVTRWADDRRWPERRAAFGPAAEHFWQWQEQTADALWYLALDSPPWPPQTLPEVRTLLQSGLHWLGQRPHRHLHPALALDAFRPIAAHLADAPPRLHLFVDAQLLISAQTTSRDANALYAASALDLPRRGVVHLTGGMGAIARTLTRALERNGGRILYRHEAERIIWQNGRPVSVEARHRRRRPTFPADIVIANLPPWNTARLLGDDLPARLRRLSASPRVGWGAFMVYAGVDEALIPPDFALHHQLIMREPLAEGNTVFMSLSPAWDAGRAPAGKRAITFSTHTSLANWWQLARHDPVAYAARKKKYAVRLLTAAETILPGLRAASELVLPGTPVTFERFTRRVDGWVGGFPQTSLFRTWGPRLGPNLWLVGDSIFPGQSTAAVALGGLRIARSVQMEATGTRKNNFGE
jgi:C-3',4' desaturase CrtD